MRIIEQDTPQQISAGQADKITVIVAVYNIAEYLERCVRSLRNQTYRNLEIILVDDGSADGSGKMCDTFAGEDDRIRVIHKPNGGLSDARNVGIEQATGTYLAFVDGDDWIDGQMYEKMLAALITYKGDFAACRYRCIYPDRTVDESTNRLAVFEGRQALESFIAEEDQYQIQNAAWNKLYRRELLGKQRFPVGKWYEDIVFTTILLSKVKRLVYLDEAFYNYVIDREGSIMSAGIGKRILTDQIPAYFEKTAFLRSIGEEELADMHNYYIYKRLLILYTQFVRSGDADKKKYCWELEQIIKREQPNFEKAFHCKAANPNEEKKMNIFMKSTGLYKITMRINDTFLIPYKTKRASKRSAQ